MDFSLEPRPKNDCTHIGERLRPVVMVGTPFSGRTMGVPASPLFARGSRQVGREAQGLAAPARRFCRKRVLCMSNALIEPEQCSLAISVRL